ncbi:MAG: tRNA (adenosine(37)-N6)-dimethylallyltransferase MiaA [Candidatus Yanofskybacteria bacterium]|nr:tRNA (adenosine(37)-N6)-dimethylallyltransferase MiaA [Candidatus Yanofskybacteria bacterium]
MKALVALVGPTASGKSELGVELALEFGGEIISADSRQVYKGMDLGAGKITKQEMRGVPHHLLDVASPKRKFTVAQYQKLALKAIAGIQKRGKLPLLVGGSPLYVYAVTDGIFFPEVKPDPKLRKELEQYSAEELYEKLQKLDPARAATIERKNPRRLVRALEIVIKTRQPVPSFQKSSLCYPVFFLGIKRSKEELSLRIGKRLQKRLKQGMLKEIQKLHDDHISWERLEDFGLEYRFGALFLQGKISKQEMTERIQKGSENLIRHQMTWFKRDSRIHWISSLREARRLISLFLTEEL